MSSNNIVKKIRASKASGKATAGSLSALPQVNDPTLQRWIKSISGIVDDTAKNYVRTQDLAKAGLIDSNGNVSIPGQNTDDGSSSIVPKAVVNLKATGAYSTVTLDWETPQNKVFGVNEVYRAEVDDFGKAVNIGSSAGDVYTDYIGNAAKVYYWVRTVSKYGVAGELSASVYAETSIDIDYVIDQLTGEISEGMLDTELKKDFDQIQVDLSNLKETADQADIAIQQAKDAASTASNQATNALNAANQEVSDRKADTSAIKSRIDDEVATINDGISQEATYRQQGDEAQTSALNAYKASNNTALGVVAQKAETAVTQSSANANNITTITATLNTKNRTYRQTTAPTANLVVGDLWINTASGKNNEQKRWNGTSWDDVTDPRIATTATGLSTLQGTVSQQGNQIAANTQAITQIDTTVGNIEDDVSANNNAIDSMRGDIIKNGNDITSVVNRTTAVENRVTTAEGKVTSNTNAISGINTQISTIDGKTTSNTIAITSLSGRMATAEDNISKKIESSALNNYYTKQQADEATAGQVTALNAGIVEKLDKIPYDGRNIALDTQVSYKGNFGRATFIVSDNIDLSSVRELVQSIDVSLTNATSLNQSNNRIGTEFFVTYTDNSTAYVQNFISMSNTAQSFFGRKTSKFIVPSGKTISSITRLIANIEGVSDLNATVSNLKLEIGAVATGWSPAPEDAKKQNDANAAALQTTNATVSILDGKLTAATNDVTSLKGRVTATENGLNQKVDTSTLQSYSTTAQMNTAISAGISQYDAALTISVDNLIPTQLSAWEDGYWNASTGVAVSDATYLRTKADTSIKVTGGAQYVVKAVNTRIVILWYTSAGAYLSYSEKKGNVATQVVTAPATAAEVRYYIFDPTYPRPNTLNQAVLDTYKLMLVKGSSTKLDWIPSTLGLGQSLAGTATALTATNASVTAVDSKVTALTTQYTALNSKVDTNQANVQNNYYSKAQTDTVVSNATTALKSEFGISGGENIVWNGDASNGTQNWGANSGVGVLSVYTNPTSKLNYLRYQSSDTTTNFKGLVQQITVASGRLKANTTYTLSFKAMCGSSATLGKALRLILHRNDGSVNNQLGTTFGNLTWSEQSFSYTFNTNVANLSHLNVIIHTDTGFAPDFMIRDVQISEGTVATAYRKSTADVVSTATQDLVSTSTMNSAISTATTALQASIDAVTVGGRNYLLASASGATGKTISDDFDWTLLPVGTTIQMAFDINITSAISAGSRNRIGFEVGINNVAGGVTYIGVWLTNVSTTAVGKYRVKGSYTITGNTLAANPKSFPFYNQASGGAFTISNVKLEVGTKMTDWSAAPEDNASATAVSQLDAKVTNIDGKSNTQASQITQLQTTQGNQQVSINQQLQVINGMQALAMLQINNNGSVTGIGVASDMINGQVKSEIGFIANRFFFESPQGKVYPMIIDGNQTIINNALIKDGSIGNAKIGSLAADKITTGNIAADRMKANIVEAATGKFSSLSVLSANMGRFESVKAGVGRGVIEGPNIWLYDTVGVNRIFIGLGD